MSDFLRNMASLSAERAANVGDIPAAVLDKPIAKLSCLEFGIIAEIKAHSPSAGQLAPAGDDRLARARQYADGGAAAISVLTEPSRFAGSMTHLADVAGAVPGTPVMRKDFLVDSIQVVEARAAGASGVLLIVAILDDATLRGMLDCAAEHGLFVLLEAFDDEDIRRIERLIGPEDDARASRGELLYGINTRNLRTLEVDAGRLERLAPSLPPGPCVAESGLDTAEDAGRVARLGYTMALVGSALMRSADPKGLVAEMTAAGRAEQKS